MENAVRGKPSVARKRPWFREGIRRTPAQRPNPNSKYIIPFVTPTSPPDPRAPPCFSPVPTSTRRVPVRRTPSRPHPIAAPAAVRRRRVPAGRPEKVGWSAAMARVYVGSLDPAVTARELEDEFRVFGVLRSVWVARKPPGFAFVDFDDRRDAQDAIKDLDGKNGWRVELSRNASSGRGGRDRSGGSEMKCYECGVEAVAAVGALDTAGVQAIAEEATAALQGVVVCHRLVGAVLAGHQSVDVTNLPPIAMGIAVAGARAIRHRLLEFGIVLHCLKASAGYGFRLCLHGFAHSPFLPRPRLLHANCVLVPAELLEVFEAQISL
ncbi:hypothetical protein ZWY2020_050145 [Hordeum vulgare]|nr:hypothetical protein ZWY2020_050145 [Hordeum vulgare]